MKYHMESFSKQTYQGGKPYHEERVMAQYHDHDSMNHDPKSMMGSATVGLEIYRRLSMSEHLKVRCVVGFPGECATCI